MRVLKMMFGADPDKTVIENMIKYMMIMAQKKQKMID